MKRVAILGASGQIGTGLALELKDSYQLLLYVRNVERMQSLISAREFSGSRVEVLPLEEFGSATCDVVINAIGPGDPARIRGMGADIIRITERFDNLVLDYLEASPSTIYVFLSTGAVYGNAYREMASEGSRNAIPVNDLRTEHFYPLAKLTAEAKHRGLGHLSIIDVRIFGYFSRHIDLASGFFLSEVANCVINETTLETSSTDFLRDYISSKELSSFIALLLEGRARNGVFDIYSTSPVSKIELLDELGRTFGLRCEIATSGPSAGAAIRKPERISSFDAAEQIGYAPRYSSLDIVVRELKALVTNHRGVQTSTA